jgi:2-keto-4-pentenoate hydratase/2-oxohepta-3-ene-1,7-dioic acid hydratase in catechol pathway
MKYVRFLHNNETKYGMLEKNDLVVEFEKGYGSDPTPHRHKFKEVKLLAPCLPSKIVAVGLNYSDHAKELNMAVPSEPVLFIKPGTSVVGPGDNIVYPASSKQLDYEAEIAAVIRKTCRRVSVENALEYILGYTCFNDITARDLQNKDGQWTRAKSFDTFSPIGPWIVSGLDTANLKIELKLNGQLKQDSSTANLIFKIPMLISFISHIMTLLPGDVVTTGTPPGVGPMNAGDTVEVTVEGIGTLKNIIKGELNA